MMVPTGDRDAFGAPDPTSPAAGLRADASAYFPGNGILDRYDVTPGLDGANQNQIFIETLRGIPAAAMGATLTLRLRAGTGGAENDMVRLGFTGGAQPGARWTQQIPGWEDNHPAQTFTYDLAALLRPGTTPLNLLPYIAGRGGALNLTVDDDTGVDWIELSYTIPGGPIDPLSQPYVSCTSYIDGADEVTLDNCGSAWYRDTFTLPPRFEGPVLSATVNADDVAVAYLNGHRISAAAVAADLTGNGADRADAAGPLLNTPSRDTLTTAVAAYFVPGVNELVFGVLKGATSPTGLEFQGTVTYREVCLADFDASGEVNANDVSTYLNGWYADIVNGTLTADFNADGETNANDLSAFINAWYAAVINGGAC